MRLGAMFVSAPRSTSSRAVVTHPLKRPRRGERYRLVLSQMAHLAGLCGCSGCNSRAQ
jgi:hypothetical protein